MSSEDSGDGARADGASAYLQVRDLSKLFGDFEALKDISLDVREGEFVCFLGPSGCGKTTLLRAIAGLDIQTRGTIVQAGRDIPALPPSERDFGIVFQSYALFPNLTAKKNVAYGLENRKMPRADVDRRVAELLATVGLPEHADKYPAQLSGGQQQRVALARALATSPGLLLLDEPLSALDAKVRVHLRHEIKSLQRTLGVTTIMVTHDQEEALTMADRIVVMNHGVIEQVGTALEIYRFPATAFIADFIGTMNFLPGTVVGPGKVRFGPVELVCEADSLSQGTAVTIAVRPEDIVVQDAGEEQENALTARIDSMEFLGSFYRASLMADGLDADQLRADLSINLVRRLDLGEGNEIPVLIPRDRIRLYPAGSSHG